MITRIKSNRIITPDGIISGYVYFEGDKITYVGNEQREYSSEINAGDNYVSPGFIDIHTHGSDGVDYSSAATPDDVRRALKCHLSHGATTILPTVNSSSPERILNALDNLKRAVSDGGEGSCVPGVHLEGPFFSTQQCGAQNTKYITAPNPDLYKKVISEYGDMILRWDYAPERDEGGRFCRTLAEHGILPSAGHTNAEYDDMVLALECGMKLVTHLYSCTSTITRKGGFRVLGVTECAYLFDDLYVEIIADGRHLPPELLRLIFKLKDHDKIILVTDSLSVAGTDATEGVLEGIEYLIEDGVCKLRDRSAFAGSIATADRLVYIVTHEAGLDITEAVKMASYNPAKLFGLNKGALEAGRDADILVFDEDIRIKSILLGGKVIK